MATNRDAVRGSVFSTDANGNVNGISTPIATLPLPTSPFGRRFLMIGDSRTAYAYGIGMNGPGGSAATQPYSAPTHPFNVANFLMGQSMTLVGNYGIASYRSDQFFATNLAACLAVPADYLYIGSAAVNDIYQALTGYTTVSGTAVTLSNVAAIAASNVQAAIAKALALGLRVIIQSECGAPGLLTTAAQTGAVFEYNERMRDFIESTPGVAWFDPNSIMWNSTSSQTALNFIAGISSDNVHINNYGGYLVGQALATFLSQFIPPLESRFGNIAENVGTTAYSILANPGFATLTGGSTGANIVLSSGTVPANWTISSGLASTSVAITNPADPSGSGTNAVQFALTFGAADQFAIIQNIGTANWNMTDILQAGCSISVASGSSNCFATLVLQVASTGGTANCSDMSQLMSAGAGLTSAYSGTMKTPKFPASTLSGTKSYAQLIFQVNAIAAGSMTVTLSRPYIRRRFS